MLSALATIGIGTVLPTSVESQRRSDCQDYTGCEPGDEHSPHHDALLLVWATQRDCIRAIETRFAAFEQKKQKEYVSPQSRWWFATDTRRWDVQRPFGPGSLDSTHSFDVTYYINDKIVGVWYVETKEKIVNRGDIFS